MKSLMVSEATSSSAGLLEPPSCKLNRKTLWDSDLDVNPWIAGGEYNHNQVVFNVNELGHTKVACAGA